VSSDRENRELAEDKPGNGREFREKKENPEIFIQFYYF